MQKKCYIIAGPNGAGKTTFANEFLKESLRGGHNVPENVIRRRYARSWENFQHTYKQLADSWTIFDTSGKIPVIVEESGES